VPEPTPSQTVGPYFAIGLSNRPLAVLVPNGLRIAGQVLDGAGEPIPDAVVEIWQADSSGTYRDGFGWGRCGTDAEGRYSFSTEKPGPVGGRAPHVNVLVHSRGLLKPVFTRMYFPGDDANAADPLLSALPDDDRASLVAEADGDGFRFDIRLQGDRQTAFFAV
jgi:protocatechuate 3,4-dioxygenase alpha subunit